MATQRKLGRPPIPAKDRRSERLEIRLSADERRTLLGGAGDAELSTWVRDVALAKARRARGGA